MEGTKHYLWQACFFSVVEGFGLRVIIEFLGMSVMWRSCGKSLGIIPALIHVFRNYQLGILRQFPPLRRSQQASSTKIGEQLPWYCIYWYKCKKSQRLQRKTEQAMISKTESKMHYEIWRTSHGVLESAPLLLLKIQPQNIHPFLFQNPS